MHIRTHTIALAVFVAALEVVAVKAAETPYYKSVSDTEVEIAVKGKTYDKANDKSPAKSFFGGGSHSSNGCCPCQGSVSVVEPSAAAPVVAEKVAPKAVEATIDATLDARLKTAISQLSTSSWQDAQTLLVESGKVSIPVLIDALNSSDAAYNLGGHTKSDAGRLPRQRTVGEVAAELLAEIVTYHTSFKGEIPGADQNAWREWWSKNAEGVTFASN